jgi:hypothetical protein
MDKMENKGMNECVYWDVTGCDPVDKYRRFRQKATCLSEAMISIFGRTETRQIKRSVVTFALVAVCVHGRVLWPRGVSRSAERWRISPAFYSVSADSTLHSRNVGTGVTRYGGGCYRRSSFGVLTKRSAHGLFRSLGGAYCLHCNGD